MKKLLLLLSLSCLSMVSAQQYEIGNAKTELKLNSDLVKDSFTSEQTLAIPVSKIETYYDIETRTCSRIECDENDTNANPTWNGFFSTYSSEEKIRILSDLIKGIGRSTAEKLVTYNLITNRPSTWTKFGNLMRHAQRELAKKGFDHDFTKEVLEVYAKENALALGYYTTTTCKEVLYTCQIPVLKEKKVFAYNLYKNLVVNYNGKNSNAHLYSFENDVIELTTEGSGETKITQKTNYNTFKASVVLENMGATIKAEISALNRNVVSAPSNMFSVSADFSAQGADLKVTTKGNYSSILTSENKIEVEYQICAKKALSWGNTSCKTPIVSGVLPINKSLETLLIPVNYTSGAKYYLSYKIRMVTSSDFKSGMLSEGASNTYKAP